MDGAFMKKVQYYSSVCFKAQPGTTRKGDRRPWIAVCTDTGTGFSHSHTVPRGAEVTGQTWTSAGFSPLMVMPWRLASILASMKAR
ncbi:hypothetical protein E2C01_007634 [Portunus trituberculatus]|uniref:Uncharacterized protein n=1 Tax=Portunus trituberculatus TaxID=210409 RepID=A0A5B7CZY0_PORTR|nr:hypothetical protein [Portunus trituberculatus]